MIDCFELLLSVKGWIAIYFFSFVFAGVETNVCLFFLILWNFILLGVYMGTHAPLVFQWTFSTDLPHFLLNGKKHPVTSRYFLGLVSICQSGFLMFFPFPQCLYILPKQHTRFMLPSVTKDSMVIFVCLGSYIWYWHPKIILIKSFIRDDII